MKKEAILAANWKMHKTASEAAACIRALIPLAAEKSCRILIAPPFTALAAAADAARGSAIEVGAQNMHYAPEGAFTGEVSSSMLKEAGASFVILGHSERRVYFHESSAFVQKKVARALCEKLTPIVCVGESLEERERGRAEEVVRLQLEQSLGGIAKEEGARLMIAYEPVWAIGTGKAATPEDAAKMHAFCRNILSTFWGKEVAFQIPLLYGGSVKGDNIAEILAQKEINGALIGGASLDPASFTHIIHSSRKS